MQEVSGKVEFFVSKARYCLAAFGESLDNDSVTYHEVGQLEATNREIRA